MKNESINVADVKKLRLERHWSQEQLAEISDLSIRTIQRIENGKKAGLESLKALSAAFEVDLANSDQKEDTKQVEKEESYIQNVRGIYKLIAVAIFSLLIPFINGLNETSEWDLFFIITVSWIVIIGVYSLNSFDLFGEEWRRKRINKKFKEKE